MHLTRASGKMTNADSHGYRSAPTAPAMLAASLPGLAEAGHTSRWSPPRGHEDRDLRACLHVARHCLRQAQRDGNRHHAGPAEVWREADVPEADTPRLLLPPGPMSPGLMLRG